MGKVACAAERLRMVRRASEHFLSLWAIERIQRRPEVLERIVQDVDRQGQRPLASGVISRRWLDD